MASFDSSRESVSIRSLTHQSYSFPPEIDQPISTTKLKKSELSKNLSVHLTNNGPILGGHGTPSYPSPLDRIRTGRRERAAQFGLLNDFRDSFEGNQSFPKACKTSVVHDTPKPSVKVKLSDFKGRGLNDVSFSAGHSRGSFMSPSDGEMLLGDAWSFYKYIGHTSSRLTFPTTVRNPNKAICMVDAQSSRILIVNEMACELFGYKEEELLTMHLRDLIKLKSKQQTSISESHIEETTGSIIDVSGKVVDAIDYTGLRVPISLWVKSLPHENEDEPRCLVVMEPVERTVATVQFDSEGYIISCDATMLQIYGYSQSDTITGIHINQLIPALKLPETVHTISKDLSKQRATGRSRSGGSFPLSIALKLSQSDHDDESQVVFEGVVWVFANISGLITFLSDGTIHSINDNFSLMMFGYTPEELIGQDVSMLIPDFYRIIEEDQSFISPPDGHNPRDFSAYNSSGNSFEDNSFISDSSECTTSTPYRPGPLVQSQSHTRKPKINPKLCNINKQSGYSSVDGPMTSTPVTQNNSIDHGHVDEEKSQHTDLENSHGSNDSNKENTNTINRQYSHEKENSNTVNRQYSHDKENSNRINRQFSHDKENSNTVNRQYSHDKENSNTINRQFSHDKENTNTINRQFSHDIPSEAEAILSTFSTRPRLRITESCVKHASLDRVDSTDKIRGSRSLQNIDSVGSCDSEVERFVRNSGSSSRDYFDDLRNSSGNNSTQNSPLLVTNNYTQNSSTDSYSGQNCNNNNNKDVDHNDKMSVKNSDTERVRNSDSCGNLSMHRSLDCRSPKHRRQLTRTPHQNWKSASERSSPDLHLLIPSPSPEQPSSPRLNKLTKSPNFLTVDSPSEYYENSDSQQVSIGQTFYVNVTPPAEKHDRMFRRRLISGNRSESYDYTPHSRLEVRSPLAFDEKDRNRKNELSTSTSRGELCKSPLADDKDEKNHKYSTKNSSQTDLLPPSRHAMFARTGRSNAVCTSADGEMSPEVLSKSPSPTPTPPMISSLSQDIKSKDLIRRALRGKLISSPHRLRDSRSFDSRNHSFDSRNHSFDSRNHSLDIIDRDESGVKACLINLSHQLSLTGNFCGQCRHKDGSNLGVVFQIKRVTLADGHLVFCIWMSRDPEDVAEACRSYANLTLASSLYSLNNLSTEFLDHSRRSTSSHDPTSHHSRESNMYKETSNTHIESVHVAMQESRKCGFVRPVKIDCSLGANWQPKCPSIDMNRRADHCTMSAQCKDTSSTHIDTSTHKDSVITKVYEGRGPYNLHYHTLQCIGKGAYGFVRIAQRICDSKPVVVKFIRRGKIMEADRWCTDPVYGYCPLEISLLSKLDHPNIVKILGQGICVYMEADRWCTDPVYGYCPLEISLLSKLDHPNIVKIVDVYHNEDFYQMVMDKHGAGMDMFEFIDRAPNMDEALGSYLFKQIVSAISYLHHKGIIHRDVKDENVILDERFHVKLIDFGAATFMAPGRMFAKFCGTLEYCSPEVLLGNKYRGPELEVWSLGVTLYTLVFGENPFYDHDETIECILKPPFTVSNSLMFLLSWMLHRDPITRMTLTQIEENNWVTQRVDINLYDWKEVLPNSDFHGNTASDNRSEHNDCGTSYPATSQPHSDAEWPTSERDWQCYDLANDLSRCLDLHTSQPTRGDYYGIVT